MFQMRPDFGLQSDFQIAVKVAFPHQGLIESFLGNDFAENTESSMAFFGGPFLFGGETSMGVQKIFFVL